jgi:hypothetical protein
MQIRVVGTPQEVAEAAARISVMLVVVRQSPPRPRRSGDGVAVYLDVELPHVPAAGPAPGDEPDDTPDDTGEPGTEPAGSNDDRRADERGARNSARPGARSGARGTGSRRRRA